MNPDSPEVDSDYHNIVANTENLKLVTEKVLDDIIDDITLGIIFDVHRKHRSRWYEEVEANQITASVHDKTEVLNKDLKKVQNSCCPICNRTLSATRFGKHLKDCMGFGRKGSRRNVSNNVNYGSNIDEEEDDSDTYSKKKKKKKKVRSKAKKTKSTISKTCSVDTDLVNVDIEGDEDGELLLRDIIKDGVNQASPTDSVASSSGAVKKSEKSKGKRSKRDRSQ